MDKHIMTRNKVIEKLTNDAVDYVMSDDRLDYTFNIFYNGFKGFNNYTNEELISEYNETFYDDETYIELKKIV